LAREEKESADCSDRVLCWPRLRTLRALGGCARPAPPLGLAPAPASGDRLRGVVAPGDGGSSSRGGGDLGGAGGSAAEGAAPDWLSAGLLRVTLTGWKTRATDSTSSCSLSAWLLAASSW
jgi:hypothetical protein